MNALIAVLAGATFFINHENRAFLKQHVVTPVGHAIAKPFHRGKVNGQSQHLAK